MSRGNTWRVYRDPNDWWIGYYRGDTHHYVCLLPTIVLRWRRRDAQAEPEHVHTYGPPAERAKFPGDPTVHRYCTGCPHFQFREAGTTSPWLDAAPPRERP